MLHISASSTPFQSLQRNVVAGRPPQQAVPTHAGQRLSRAQALDTLRFLNGQWDCYGMPNDAPSNQPVAKTTGRIFEDTWVQATTKVRQGHTNGAFRSHMSFDEHNQEFAETNFVSSGDMGTSRAPGWMDNTLTFTGQRLRSARADDVIAYRKTYTKLSDHRYTIEAQRRDPGQDWQVENRGLCDKMLDSPDAYPQRLGDDPLARVQAGIGLKRISWSAIEHDVAALRDQPLHIRTTGTDLGRELRVLQRKCAPSVLRRSPLADDRVMLIDGLDTSGNALTQQKRSLADLVAPCLQSGFPWDTNAFAFSGIMVNRDRPDLFKGAFPPVEPWHQYFLNDEPKSFPTTLLEGARPEHFAGTTPKLNTSVMLGVGKGKGQYFHIHGGNVFVQLWGEKKWSIFLQEHMKPFLDPQRPYVRRQPAPFLPAYTQLMQDMLWDDKAFPELPRPMEIITRPGDMLYLPDFTWHATWNLSDYTVGYTKVVDI